MKKAILLLLGITAFVVSGFSQIKTASYASIKKNNLFTLQLPGSRKTGTESRFKSLIANLPELSLVRHNYLRPSAVKAAFSFSDIFEGTFESINPNLVNTYDDDFPELFETPSFKIKISYIITL